jgi:hypothetical protein
VTTKITPVGQEQSAIASMATTCCFFGAMLLPIWDFSPDGTGGLVTLFVWTGGPIFLYIFIYDYVVKKS